MFSKLLLTAVTLGVVSNAFAAEEAKKVETVKTWKDKLILSFHGEFGITRKDSTTDDNVMTNPNNNGEGKSLGKLKDFTQFYNPAIGYKLTDSITFSSSWEFRYADHTGRPKFTNRFYRALFSLSKSNILTEKEYGFQLDAGIARRYFDRKAVPSTYGNDRINMTLTKNFDKNNVSLFLQYLTNDPKNASSNETWRRGYEIIPTANLQLTDKLSLTITDDININTPWTAGKTINDVTISHEFNFAVFTYKVNDLVSSYLQLKYNYLQYGFYNPGTFEDYEYYIGASYSVTPKITLTAEMGSSIFEAHDSKSGTSEKLKKPEFTLYVDASF